MILSHSPISVRWNSWAAERLYRWKRLLILNSGKFVEKIGSGWCSAGSVTVISHCQFDVINIDPLNIVNLSRVNFKKYRFYYKLTCLPVYVLCDLNKLALLPKSRLYIYTRILTFAALHAFHILKGNRLFETILLLIAYNL